MFATFDILAWVLVIAGMDDIRGSRQVVSALQSGHSPRRQSIAILLHQQIYLSIIYQKGELRRGIKSNEGLVLLLC